MAKQKAGKRARQRPATTAGAPLLAPRVDRTVAGPKSFEQIFRGAPDLEKLKRNAAAVFYAADFMHNMRLKAGMTHQQMASALGRDASFIFQIERGLGLEGPSWSLLVQWAHACGKELTLRSAVVRKPHAPHFGAAT